jgi:hypothetical protein
MTRSLVAPGGGEDVTHRLTAVVPEATPREMVYEMTTS